MLTNKVKNEVVNRINQLSSNSRAQWGKMNVAQMLAHCNVTYEMIYTDKHPKPNAFVKFMLKTFVKGKVVSTIPYPKNGRTAPQFKIEGTKQFEEEKQLLITNIEKTLNLGEEYFNGKESHSFGPLTSGEWNNMFFKHLNHHLNQFGV